MRRLVTARGAELVTMATAVAMIGCGGPGGDARAEGGEPARPTPAAARPAPPAARPAEPDPADLGDGNRLLAPIRYQGLTLLPVVATGTVDETDYLTLDEGMASRQVRIREVGDDGAEVNELTLTNRSARPLFVMTGEVIVGGKQDRIIGRNTVVPPRTTQKIPVYCVEHGRWEGRRAEFRSAGVLAHATLRAKASYEGQGDVWNEVAVKNAKRHHAPATGTYRQTAAEQQGQTIEAWAAHFDRPLAALPAPLRQRLVGYAVALDGEVVAVDVFDAPKLFARLDGKLRRSYYAEAIDAPVVADARVPTAADVKAFLAEPAAAPDQPVYDTGEADTIQNVGEAAASTKVMLKGARRGARPLYKSVQKHAKKTAAPAPELELELAPLRDAPPLPQRMRP